MLNLLAYFIHPTSILNKCVSFCITNAELFVYFKNQHSKPMLFRNLVSPNKLLETKTHVSCKHRGNDNLKYPSKKLIHNKDLYFLCFTNFQDLWRYRPITEKYLSKHFCNFACLFQLVTPNNLLLYPLNDTRKHNRWVSIIFASH